MSAYAAVDAMAARLCARIDSGEIQEAPLGPLCQPPVHLDRKTVRYRAVVRDAIGRAVEVHEDAAYARAVVDAYNRVAEHFAARRVVPMGRERA